MLIYVSLHCEVRIMCPSIKRVVLPRDNFSFSKVILTAAHKIVEDNTVEYVWVTIQYKINRPVVPVGR